MTFFSTFRRLDPAAYTQSTGGGCYYLNNIGFQNNFGQKQGLLRADVCVENHFNSTRTQHVLYLADCQRQNEADPQLTVRIWHCMPSLHRQLQQATPFTPWNDVHGIESELNFPRVLKVAVLLCRVENHRCTVSTFFST